MKGKLLSHGSTPDMDSMSARTSGCWPGDRCSSVSRTSSNSLS